MLSLVFLWGLAPVLVFALFQVSLWWRVGFMFVPVLLCWHLHIVLGLAFAFACRQRLESCSPFCGDALAIHSLFCGGASCTCLPSCNNLPSSCLVTPCAQGTNAPGLAAVALAASPAGLTLEVPLARAGPAPTTRDAPYSLCVMTPGVSTSPASAISAAPAGLRGSGSSRSV